MTPLRHLQYLADDPKWVGAKLGILAVRADSAAVLVSSLCRDLPGEGGRDRVRDRKPSCGRARQERP